MLLSPSNQACRKTPVPEEDYEIWLKAPQKLASEPFFGQNHPFCLFLLLSESEENLVKRYMAND